MYTLEHSCPCSELVSVNHKNLICQITGGEAKMGMAMSWSILQPQSQMIYVLPRDK